MILHMTYIIIVKKGIKPYDLLKNKGFFFKMEYLSNNFCDFFFIQNHQTPNKILTNRCFLYFHFISIKKILQLNV